MITILKKSRSFGDKQVVNVFVTILNTCTSVEPILYDNCPE